MMDCVNRLVHFHVTDAAMETVLTVLLDILSGMETVWRIFYATKRVAVHFVLANILYLTHNAFHVQVQIVFNVEVRILLNALLALKDILWKTRCVHNAQRNVFHAYPNFIADNVKMDITCSRKEHNQQVNVYNAQPMIIVQNAKTQQASVHHV